MTNEGTYSPVLAGWNETDTSERETVTSYVARCYGDDGDEPGDVPIAVVPTTDGGWGVLEVPDECTIWHTRHATKDDAVAAAEALREKLHEA